MPLYNNSAILTAMNRQAFLSAQNKKKKKKVKRKEVSRKEKAKGFFEVMRPNIKLAFLFFLLAKMSCFTIAPGAVALAHFRIIPLGLSWVGIAIYGAFIFLSIFFGLKEMLGPKQEAPSREDVERWMKHYNLETK